ncbi:P-type conjugative transfer protein TrbL [Caulobacter soli]|uniref:P-type conjugative transfer protein TrbL n=1 Tax=Caulobacter soli TaxID=2708539 RepID=UPI0013ECD3E8|nr:P-type conjugative transfer protein TrbL [Caulobacter soli]
MQTASPAALDEYIARFTQQVGGGFGLIQGDVRTTFAALIVISLGLAALLWAVDENDNVPAALIRKLLLFGFFAWLISNWHSLTLTVIKGFTALGLKAGGGRMSVADLLNSPSKIVWDGLEVAFDLLKYVGRLASEGMGVGFFTHIDTILVTAIVIIGVILAFVLLGVEVVVTVIEFYVVTLISFVMVPFGILTQTAFLAERAIAYVPAVGAKLMALALVISIGEQIFASYVVSAEPTWQESCGLLVAAIVFLMLALKIPSVAAAQITGSPQLSAGSAASSVVGLAASAGGLALAGRWAAGGLAAGAGASAARGAAGLRGLAGGRGPGAASGGGAGPSPGGGPSGGGAPSLGGVVSRARSSFSPQASSPSPSPPPSPSPSGDQTGGGDAPPVSSAPRRRGRAAWTAAGAAPWREDAAGQPAGMPRIHPPTDEA